MSVIDDSMRPMLDMFTFETTTLLDGLDEILLEAEKEKNLSNEQINEIFRAMHTVKGSAAMMGLTELSEMTHRAEDMFFIIRDDPSKLTEQNVGAVLDILFQVSDFLRQEMSNLQDDPDGGQSADPAPLTAIIQNELAVLKGEKAPQVAEARPLPVSRPAAAQGDDVYTFRVLFQNDCEMPNVRAFLLISQLKEYGEILETTPANPESDPNAIQVIEQNGFLFRLRYSGDMEMLGHVFEEDTNISSYEEIDGHGAVFAKPAAAAAEDAEPLAEAAERQKAQGPVPEAPATGKAAHSHGAKQSLISVNQSKIDSLVDIMGEIVIAESMVASNPDLSGMTLDNFSKSARHLRKLTDQMQDIVMSIRMVPLTGTFQKMGRIVRDMNKNLGKETELVTEGGETEVDKSVIDMLADPLMHMIRNSMDHGIEPPAVRLAAGKPEQGRVLLTARNVGSDILISVEDDGSGLDAEFILDKAEQNGLLAKPRNEYTSREAFALIMAPGFSTNKVVTEYSGRGVGLDVVRKNIEKLGGTVSVDGEKGKGTRFSIKIPLTLAIVEGMQVGVADDTFTIPITSISQIYKMSEETELLHDTDGTEMVMVRGVTYPILRLHEIFGIDSDVTSLSDGILIIVESNGASACVFTDRLIGEQQVVVKTFPRFFDKYRVKEVGFSGCTIMGDGSISLILDVNSLLGKYRSDASLSRIRNAI